MLNYFNTFILKLRGVDGKQLPFEAVSIEKRRSTEHEIL